MMMMNLFLKILYLINFGETWRPKIMKVNNNTGEITEIFPNTDGSEWF